MAFKNTLAAVRYYTAADPYTYSVDNRPLTDLDANVQALSDRVDAVMIGRIDITGAATPTTNSLPTGWSVTRNGVGDYTITHNLNTTNYSIIGSCFSATGAYNFTAYNIALNNFSIRTVNLSGLAAADVRFMIHFSTAA